VRARCLAGKPDTNGDPASENRDQTTSYEPRNRCQMKFGLTAEDVARPAHETRNEEASYAKQSWPQSTHAAEGFTSPSGIGTRAGLDGSRGEALGLPYATAA